MKFKSASLGYSNSRLLSMPRYFSVAMIICVFWMADCACGDESFDAQRTETVPIQSHSVIRKLAQQTVESENWVEDTYDDFADGHFGASGENIYASADGTIRTIHRFDLNNDGWIDVIYNSTHDLYWHVPAAIATVNQLGQMSETQLAVRGSTWSTIADLNRDGHLDAVFLPSESSGTPRLSIFYGNDTGWSVQRSSTLPIGKATRLAVADLNADGWPDLVVLHAKAWAPGQPKDGIVRIYWSTFGTYLPSCVTDIDVQQCIDLVAIDVGASKGVAVLTSSGKIELLWSAKNTESSMEIARSQMLLPRNGVTCIATGVVDGDAQPSLVIGSDHERVYVVSALSLDEFIKNESLRTRDQQPQVTAAVAARSLPAPSASHISIGDLDGDGRSELVLVNFNVQRAAGNEAAGVKAGSSNEVTILWGQSNGFSAEAMKLSIPNASFTAIGDLNGDGLLDLAISVYQGSKTFTATSRILLGTGKRRFSTIVGPTTEGALHVNIAPSDTNQPARAVFANSQGGTLFERVPTQIYWNGPEGFRPDNLTSIPFKSGYGAAAADLNNDGYVDLVILNSGHSGGFAAADSTLGANILWGGSQGFDIQNRQIILRRRSLCSANIADLNRDGYLDLVLGQFDAPPEVENLYICYGGFDGFSEARMVAVPSWGRSHSCVIGDFDRDQWLDIAVASTDKHLLRVFWGSKVGIVESRQELIPIHLPVDISTADLNGDGFLDLVVGSFRDYVSDDPYDLGGTTILWGSKSGFSASNSQWLPGFSPLGHSIADFDGDGYLDLLAPHYHAGFTRESLPTYLFWGSAEGLDQRRKTILTANSAADSLAADFNRDGKLDISLVCHRVDDDHHTDSLTVYNDGKRFADPKITKLPTQGPHWMWGRDMGHIYDRKWEEFYESSAFRMAHPRIHGVLTAKAATPTGTQLRFAVRSAKIQDALFAMPWNELDDTGQFLLNLDDQWFQYRAVFISDNGDRFPTLDRVNIEFASVRADNP